MYDIDRELDTSGLNCPLPILRKPEMSCWRHGKKVVSFTICWERR